MLHGPKRTHAREASRLRLFAGFCILLPAALWGNIATAQPTTPPDPTPAQPAPAGAPLGRPTQPGAMQTLPPTHSGSAGGVPSASTVNRESYGGGSTAQRMLQVPVSRLFPGAVEIKSGVKNPVAGNAEAATRGMRYFNAFNCSGCHAANGGGGMGPSLSNSTFIYGSDPANIYLSIYQGRAHGMPAWGAMLPDDIIWDVVTYVQSISKAPDEKTWGRTTSAETMKIEQVPAEYLSTPDPWSRTERFSFGQKPNSAR